MTEGQPRGRMSPAVAVVAGVALAFLVLPLVALAIRAPWATLPGLLANSPGVGEYTRSRFLLRYR